MLYIVPTPIGNLEDFTYRATRILNESDLILAEDTRTSKRLLQHYEIQTPLKSFHAHNEHGRLNEIIQLLQEGKTLSLISDAGTPGISDPGFLLVRACYENDIKVSCLPGASAAICAVVMSGLPCDRFHFEGFLPIKKGRQTRMKYLAELEASSVIYLSPHKLIKTLKMFSEFCGNDRPAAVVREISKIYEEAIRSDLSKLIAHFSNLDSIKGEYVLVLAGRPKKIKPS